MSTAIRLAALLAGLAAACSVPEKVEPDGGGDPDAPDAPDGPDLDAPDGPPQTFIESPPAFVPTRALELRFSADRTATFLCSVDGGSPSVCASPLTIEFEDGPHDLAVTAVAGGVPDETPATAAWVTDTIAPDAYFTSGPPAVDNSEQVRLEFDADEDVTFTCALDGGGASACTSPLDLAVGEGLHTVVVTATDRAGHVDPDPAEWSWRVELGTPDTTIHGGPNSASASSRADFTFSSDAGTGATFECRLDTAAFAPCTSPRTYLGLAEGMHTFEVQARDTFGVLDPTPASRTWTVDTTRPVVTIETGPAGPVPSTAASFTFSATESPVTYTCRLDNAAAATCTTPHQLDDLPQGAHTLSVFATDAAGNISAAVVDRAWTVDTQPPDTTLSGPPPVIGSTSATFTIGSNEQGVTFQCGLDSAGLAPCTASTTITVAPGAHTLRAVATDAAGNSDQSAATWSWTVDGAAPDTTITPGIGPSGTVNYRVASFTYSSTESGTFQCSLDGGAFIGCTSGGVTYTNLSDGQHQFAVKAFDAVLNEDLTPATRTWTIDTSAPDTFLNNGPQGNVNTAGATFSFSSNDGAASFRCKLDLGTFGPCTSPHTYADVGQGSHTFTVKAVDPASNEDPTPATRTWFVDSVGPVVNITGGPSGTAGPGAIFTFTIDVGTARCSLDGASFAPCTSPMVYSLRPGNHTFEVESFDSFGNRGSATRAWTVACAPPSAPPGAVGHMRMEDALTSQVVDNLVSGRPDARLGPTSSVETTDPLRFSGGPWGNALRFAGGEMDQVTWPAALSTHDFSVEMWVKPNLAFNASIIDHRIAGSMFLLGGYGGTTTANFYVYIDGDNGSEFVSTAIGPGVPMNQWHHVVVTYTGQTLSVYLDGVRYQNTDAIRTAPFDFSSIQIGSPRSNDMFVGEMDELSFSNVAWTQQQALDRYCPL